MSKVGEFRLEDDQVDRIIAALLTVASLGSHVTPVERTYSQYETILQLVSSKGFGKPSRS
jgi:hypothetical protein